MVMKNNKVIISCAITGSIHTPSMSPYLPVTPNQIAEQAIEAAQAGAAILHLHARDPKTGKPSADPKVYMEFLPRIKQATPSVINITTGGSTQMTLDDRILAGKACSPEMCSLNMGSMNFGTFPMLERQQEWQHDWEPGFLAATKSAIFANSFEDIERILQELGEVNGTQFEFECYDSGHIQTLAWYLRKARVKPPIFLQFVLGVLGGADASAETLMHMKATADRLLGDTYRFSVLAAGRQQIPLATLGAILGGNVRVGLEDNLYIAKGKLAVSNAEQVRKIRVIIEELGLEIATPDDARAMLALKGADKVGF